jgi:hypothetical protein
MRFDVLRELKTSGRDHEEDLALPARQSRAEIKTASRARRSSLESRAVLRA